MRKYITTTGSKIFTKNNTKNTKSYSKHAESVTLDIHNQDPYWNGKLESSHQFNTYITKLQKIVNRFNKLHGMHVDIFLDTKKYYKQFKFVCKLKMLGSGISFSTEKMSENYIKAAIEAMNQSITYLKHQESVTYGHRHSVA